MSFSLPDSSAIGLRSPGMLFNSSAFWVFFTVVYGLYLSLLAHPRAQNAVLLVASYFLYGYWDYRFCFLLAATTVTQYLLAQSRSSAPCSGTASATRWSLSRFPRASPRSGYSNTLGSSPGHSTTC